MMREISVMVNGSYPPTWIRNEETFKLHVSTEFANFEPRHEVFSTAQSVSTG
jgi:hypothetical protein